MMAYICDKKEVLIIMKICQIVGCMNKHAAKGYCHKHYKRFIREKNGLFVRKKSSLQLPCRIEGCNKKPFSLGYCLSHAQKIIDPNDPFYYRIDQRNLFKICSVDSCKRPSDAKGYCKRHYSQYMHKQP
ncbi:hypothetical protein [Priestia megaterium]|uniref:hypothetical protein n=1 Tax=Priestia megaterium TaxID=1404 RepID=UPI0036DFA1C1